MGVFGSFETNLVWLACEPDKAFIVYVDLQRVDACHKNIQPNVKFVTVEEQGVRDILANDMLLAGWRQL